MKKGLIMEGGAMRGMFTCGVIDVLMENGIEFDGAVGVSAGAVFGCNYKSHQIGRAIRYNKTFSKDKHYGSFSSLLRTGYLYDPKFCYETIPFKLDLFDTITYRQNPMKFYAVVTDCESGAAIYHRCDKGDIEDCRWLMASASMPIVSRFVEIDGHKYLDGGISDSIPVRFMEDHDYDRNVVILTQPDSYVKKPAAYLPAVKMIYRNYPNMVKRLLNRHNEYNEEVEYVRKREAEGKLFVIRPEAPLNIGASENDVNELERVYQLGRKEGEKRLEALKEYLND